MLDVGKPSADSCRQLCAADIAHTGADGEEHRAHAVMQREGESLSLFVDGDLRRVTSTFGGDNRGRGFVRRVEHHLGSLIAECDFAATRAVEDAVYAITRDDRNGNHAVEP